MRDCVCEVIALDRTVVCVIVYVNIPVICVCMCTCEKSTHVASLMHGTLRVTGLWYV